MRFQFRVLRHELVRGVLSGGEHLHVGTKVRDMSFRQSMLAVAEEVAGPSQPQVLLTDGEAIGQPCHDFQPFPGNVIGGVGYQDTPAFMLPTANTAPQLM